MNTLLDNLPDINFCEKSPDVIISEVVADIESELGRTLNTSDPLYLVALAFCKYLSLQRSIIDYSAKQNLVKYATGGYLENIGALVGTKRIETVSAVTTLKFTLSASLNEDTVIPKGTRVCNAEKVYFATDEEISIKAGETEVEVSASCTMPGIVGNGIEVGMIHFIVDIFSYYASVINTTLTQGGVEEESEDNYRGRIVEAPEGFSVAGPSGAYRYFAMSASSLISDVNVSSPQAGYVDIVVLLEGGEIPESALLNEVKKICSADNVRPLTDNITVSAPQKVEYEIDITYYINDVSGTSSESIKAEVEAAVEKYKKWQCEKLKRHIDPTELIKRVKNAGADYVEVRSPTAVKLKSNNVAFCRSQNIMYGGEWDD